MDGYDVAQRVVGAVLLRGLGRAWCSGTGGDQQLLQPQEIPVEKPSAEQIFETRRIRLQRKTPAEPLSISRKSSAVSLSEWAKRALIMQLVPSI